MGQDQDSVNPTKLVEVKFALLKHTTSALTLAKDLRQCLIYDSGRKDARLIGIEYMIPKHLYETLDADEQQLWHFHEFEVLSGMLVAVQPSSVPDADEWEKKEIEAMRVVVGLYGKTWHFWQVDRGDVLPLGTPRLMGSVTHDEQIDLKAALARRDQEYKVDHQRKSKMRLAADIQGPGVHDHADSWWRNERLALCKCKSAP